MIDRSESDLDLSGIKNQIYAAIIANIVILSHGCVMGWMSPALPVLLSDHTPLKTGPITNEQLSWIGAMNSVGAIVGTFITGLMSAILGSKRTMTFIAYPAIAFWLLVYFGDTYYHIYLARFATGLTGGGMQSGVVLYVSEIANNNVRGRLGSILPLARNLGILIAFIAGSFIQYEYRPYIFIFVPIIYLVLVYFLPNTPSFYLKKDNIQQAERSLAYYKASDIKSDHLKLEFERIKSIEEERRKNAKIQLKDFSNRSALKGIITAIAMSWFFQTTGCVIIMNYASLIFEISGTAMSVDTSSIILAVIQIVGGLVSTQIGDKFGRKSTLIVSLCGSAVGLAVFMVYSYLRQNGNDVSNFLWLPVVCLSVIIFISSAGIAALVNTCTIENFPPKIRSTGMIFYSLCLNGVALLGEKFFPILVKVIFLHGFLLFLVVNCCLGIVFVAFMKETKGYSIDTANEIHKENVQKQKY